MDLIESIFTSLYVLFVAPHYCREWSVCVSVSGASNANRTAAAITA